MGGWGRGIMNVTPQGRVLPCHAAETIPGLEFDNVREKRLADIWLNGQAFQKYRGTSWMKEPCRSCPRAEIDFGGCRCQAMAFTGDAANTDPACSFSPYHAAFVAAAEQESAVATPPAFVHRRMSAAKPVPAK
jgi:pyrroloquinoline quinone biosynthesis protein E